MISGTFYYMKLTIKLKYAHQGGWRNTAYFLVPDNNSSSLPVSCGNLFQNNDSTPVPAEKIWKN